MATETLDRLYLEWSQFTKARTQREILMIEALKSVDEYFVFFDTIVPPDKARGARAALNSVRETLRLCK
jgi:hypothetical protein